MSSTTIRVSTETRDRLNELAAELGKNVQDSVAYLLDQDWKSQCIADWDRFREEDPDGYRQHLADTEIWDDTLADGTAPLSEMDAA